MGRRSSSIKKSSSGGNHPEVPGCFNGIWSAPEADDSTPVARKSLSERKFSEGFEAPRNSLDITSAVLERQQSHNAAAHSDEIPFGFEFALRRSSSERLQQPPRLMIPSPAAAAAAASNMEPKCRSPSVIARLMGLDTLPSKEEEQQQQRACSKPPLQAQAWNLMAERCDFSNGQKQQHFSRQLSCNATVPLVPFSAPSLGSHKHDHQDDELLLFDVLPFREQHPQEKQLQKLKDEFQSRKAKLEELKEELMLKQLRIQRPLDRRPNSLPRSVSAASKMSRESSRDMLEAIQFLQSNKDFLVKFLQEPDSAFAKHVYDLQALAAKEASLAENNNSSKSKVLNSSKTSQQGFSRKLDSERRREAQPVEVPQKQQLESNSTTAAEQQHGSRIILLKPNVKKQSTSSRTSSRESSPVAQVDQSRKNLRSLKDVDASTDPKELAREIVRHVRERVTKELELANSAKLVIESQSTTSVSPRPWSLTRQGTGGGEGSEPSSRRYTAKEHQLTAASLPSSPRLSSKTKSNVSSKEGRKQLLEKLKMTTYDDHKDESNVFIQIELAGSTKQAGSKGPCAEGDRKAHKGKLLKLFSKESVDRSGSTDVSPRHLVRSKSASSLAEDKGQGAQALERTHSCKTGTEHSSKVSSADRASTSTSKGKLSSLKSSLLGKKRNSKTSPSSEKSPTSLVKPVEDRPRTSGSVKEDAPSSCDENVCSAKITLDTHSPRFLTLEIAQGLEQLDAVSDIHRDKSEQPSPVSVLERAFLEESPSPVSFEDASSDLQELQMRLERLKLDESGRTWNIGQSKDASIYEELTPTSSSTSTCSESPASFDGDDDQLYIKRLLDASGFSNSLSLTNWYSPSCPMDPCLFAKLEEQYSNPQLPSHWQTSVNRHGSRAQRKLKIGRPVTEVQRRPETLHRQMLFDLVNEVLSNKFQHLWNDEPWHKADGIKPIPSGRNLLHEVCRQISLYQHEYESREYPLENLVERDVNRGDQWMDLQSEAHRIASKLEDDIFNSLIEEIARGSLH